MSASLSPPSRFSTLRNAFLSGLVLLAPLAVTWVVFSWLVDKVGGSFRELLFFFVPENLRNQPTLEIGWNILATAIVVILVTTLGYISRYVAGHYFGRAAERLIQNIPGISTVYRTVKQIVETFSAQKRAVFQQVVLVQFPSRGIWAIGFLTNEVQGEAQAVTAESLHAVFVPTTPNPTSGFLVLIPHEDITPLAMSVGDGMKFIISGGTVVPPWPDPAAPGAPAPVAITGNASLASPP
jgi:uncharacterized membrane protein